MGNKPEEDPIILDLRGDWVDEVTKKLLRQKPNFLDNNYRAAAMAADVLKLNRVDPE